MLFLSNNKFLFSIVSASIISLIIYKYSAANINTLEEEDKSISFNSLLIKGILIAVFVYVILYFIEDDENEVFDYIETGEPNF